MYFRRLIRDTFNCINIIDEKVENTLTTKDRKSQSNLLEIKMKVTDFQVSQAFMILIYKNIKYKKTKS